jgi:hypothetical protein
MNWGKRWRSFSQSHFSLTVPGEAEANCLWNKAPSLIPIPSPLGGRVQIASLSLQERE